MADKVKSKAPQHSDEELMAEPMSLGYRPTLPLQAINAEDSGSGALWQILFDIPHMKRHPITSAAMMCFQFGIKLAEFEVQAEDSAVGEFVLSTIRRIWDTSLDKLQIAYDYGWTGCEARYEIHGGMMRFAEMYDFFPLDCRPLMANNQYCGFELRMSGNKILAGNRFSTEDMVAIDSRMPSAGNINPGRLRLWSAGPSDPAKGIWIAHRPQYSTLFGMTQYYAAWRPWRRLAPRDGYEEVLDMGFYRFAFSGPIVYYPPGSAKADVGPSGGRDGLWNHRDRAREMAEGMKAGASIAIPSVFHEKTGNRMWDVKFPDRTLNMSPLIENMNYIEKLIFFGMGVPPEILQASETGSGYSGRHVAKEGFFMSQQSIANAFVTQLNRQMIQPLVNRNFGFGDKYYYTIKVKPLLKSVEQSAGGGEAGGDHGGAEKRNPLTSLLQGATPTGPQAKTLEPKMEKLDQTAAQQPTPSSDGQVGLALNPDQAGGVPEWTVPALWAEVLTQLGIHQIGFQKRLVAAIRTAVDGVPVAMVAQNLEEVYQTFRPDLSRIMSELYDLGVFAGLTQMIDPLPLAGPWMDSLPADLLAAVMSMLPESVQVAILSTVPAAIREPLIVHISSSRAGQLGRTLAWQRETAQSTPDIVYPVVQYATEYVLSKRPTLRSVFDTLSIEGKRTAFTVARMHTEAEIGNVQRLVEEAIRNGVSQAKFARTATDMGLRFMSRHHMETVFRTNVMQAYGEGQYRLLDDPLVASQFPYVARWTIDDDRRRDTHGWFETHGIDGTNLYRTDDPVWQKFRAPWEFNCRCIDVFTSVERAAMRGLAEAIRWRDTGIPPISPTRVEHPPFDIQANWQRLSIATYTMANQESDDAYRTVMLPTPECQNGHVVAPEKRDLVAIVTAIRNMAECPERQRLLAELAVELPKATVADVGKLKMLVGVGRNGLRSVFADHVVRHAAA